MVRTVGRTRMPAQAFQGTASTLPKKYAHNAFVCVCRFRLRLLHVTSTSIIAQIFCQICTPRRVKWLLTRLCGSCGGEKW